MQLETERLILREWQENDIDDLVEGLNNFNVSKWLASIPYPYTEKDAEDFINYAKEKAVENPRKYYTFAIVLKLENKVIGGIGLENINYIRGTAGGGIWLNLNYGGHGYGAEAFRRRNDFAFGELNLRRLENGYFEGNRCSEKMQLKLGYTIEGKKRKSYISRADGQEKDEIITAILKEDWLKLKK